MSKAYEDIGKDAVGMRGYLAQRGSGDCRFDFTLMTYPATDISF